MAENEVTYCGIVLEMPGNFHGFVKVVQDDRMEEVSTVSEATNWYPKTP